MKSLKDFIMEASEDSKEITFDFDGIENAEETLKSLGEHDCVTVDGNKVTIKITTDNVDSDCVEGAQDILQQAVQAARSSSKSTNDEQYGQKVAALEKKIAEMNDAIDEIANPDEDDTDEDDDKKDDEE